MIPVKQTILHDPANGVHGNCFSAVLASLLHLPIEEVPLFINPQTWVRELNAWLRPRGLAYLQIVAREDLFDDLGVTGCHHEVAGNTVRSADVLHACVGQDGRLRFDPHPDDTGLTKTDTYGFLLALRPWEWVPEEEGQRP